MARLQTQTDTPKDIKDILSCRSDLSTFLVHLTRDNNDKSAKDNLGSIIRSWTIEARSPLGSAVKRLTKKGMNTDSQKCVCFTEAPLEYIRLMLEKIDDRDYQFAPYGIAITKKLARIKDVNPVWYIDITPGRDWLMTPINKLINQTNGDFDDSPISQITPFIEQMGTGPNRSTGTRYRKEFWWEREWRHVCNFALPDHIIIICPDENDSHRKFEDMAAKLGHSAKCIDPSWGLEKIIARLAGFRDKDIDIL